MRKNNDVITITSSVVQEKSFAFYRLSLHNEKHHQRACTKKFSPPWKKSVSFSYFFFLAIEKCTIVNNQESYNQLWPRKVSWIIAYHVNSLTQPRLIFDKNEKMNEDFSLCFIRSTRKKEGGKRKRQERKIGKVEKL